jgi:hypothetical protein
MTPEEEKTQFYAAVGQAVIAWNQVESTLLRLFHYTLNGARFGEASSAFYAVAAFNAKLDITNSTVTYRLADHDDLYAEWATPKSGLYFQISSKASIRNRIVHSTTMHALTAKAGRQWWLEPDLMNARTWPAVSDEPPMYYRTDLLPLPDQFESLAKRIGSLAAYINELPKQPEESLRLRSDQYFARLRRALTPKTGEPPLPPSEESGE